MNIKLKPTQKLIFSKDNASTSTEDMSIVGLFKSTSSLANSLTRIKKEKQSKENFGDYYQHEEKRKVHSVFLSSAHQIINQENTNKVKSGLKELRNLTHFYKEIDTNEKSYNLLSALKAEKRMKHLNTLDAFDVWKNNFILAYDDKIKRKIEDLKNNLEKTKSNLNSEFSRSEQELITFNQSNINQIEKLYEKIILKRNEEILYTINNIKEYEQEALKSIDSSIFKLSEDLDTIGYLLDFEVSEIKNNKNEDKINLFNHKRSVNNDTFNTIIENENKLKNESKINLFNFILKWKNVKLNYFILLLKQKLQSDDFVDNKERYDIIAQIKADQENIYHKRIDLIINKMFALPANEINVKKIEQINKELEDIYNNAQKIYDNYTQLLLDDSEQINQKYNHEIEAFKQMTSSINYEFGIDNLNQDFNAYSNINSLEELIELELTPLNNSNKNNRKDFNTKIISYLDDNDEYVNNNCLKLVNLFNLIAIRNDEHIKQLSESEKKYLTDLAKAADNNDDFISEKEELIKKLIEQIKTSIDKDELNNILIEIFNILDQLNVEYRNYFDAMENLFDSHENRLIDKFKNFEIRTNQLFGLLTKEKYEQILQRRNIESDFLSRKKEALLAEELRLEEEKNAKNANQKGKKNEKSVKANAKKGEIQNIFPSRAINEFKSVLNFDYLIDFTIKELVNHNLRNIIYNREDDIFGLNNYLPNGDVYPNIVIDQAKVNNDNKTNNIEKENKIKKDKKTNEKETKANNNDNKNRPISTTTNNEIDYLNLFNSYEADTNKTFISPLSLKGNKLLSEENLFIPSYLTELLEKLFQSLANRIKTDLKYMVDVSKINDNGRREELLTELDIRLKSIDPRKGKIEVEEYDKRMSQVDKHIIKYEHHAKNITDRNTKDNLDNNNLLNEINNSFIDLNQLYDKLFKGMEEEQTIKGLNEKYKKFKSSFYDLNTKISELEILLKTFSKTNPQNLIQLNNNFLVSLQLIESGGTYSKREITFYTEKINKLNEEIIIKDMKERELNNGKKVEGIRASMNNLLEKIEKKFAVSNEEIMAKESVGKKFGAPKRYANDVIITIKLKCNQAKDGLDILYNDFKAYINEYKLNKSSFAYLKNNNLPLLIRRQLLAINNCVFVYGKYLEAINPNLINTYSLKRVSLKDNSSSIELTTKEELEEDDKRKQSELISLGILVKSVYIDNVINTKDNKKEKEKDNINFASELNAMDDKVKSECIKIYTGEFAKIINNQDKMPSSLVAFITNLKNEMEIFRMQCIRELRTYCQNMFNLTLEIALILFEYLFSLCYYSNKIVSDNLFKEFTQMKENSDKTKKELNAILGPYLANSYYLKELIEIENKENERQSNLINAVNNIQMQLLINEEKTSEEFIRLTINNFEAIICLFDNLLFEEEFISFGDEEYFKSSKDYNFLLKLKSENKANINLDLKRSFKKNYVGIDKNRLKINYYEKFKQFINAYIQNSDEKIKILEKESNNSSISKNIIGLKLQNNKILFKERNNAYSNYCNMFIKNVDDIITKFNKQRNDEIEYQKRWKEIIDELKK